MTTKEVEGSSDATIQDQQEEVIDINPQRNREDWQRNYEDLTRELSALRKERIITADPAVKFELEEQIDQAEKELVKLEQKLEELENMGEGSTIE